MATLANHCYSKELEINACLKQDEIAAGKLFPVSFAHRQVDKNTAYKVNNITPDYLDINCLFRYCKIKSN